MGLNKFMKEKIKKICLILAVIGLLGFYAQPTQAGLFDWFANIIFL